MKFGALALEELEISKLEALDRVNCEIWNRIVQAMEKGWDRVSKLTVFEDGTFYVEVNNINSRSHPVFDVLVSHSSEALPTLKSCWIALEGNDKNLFRSPLPCENYGSMRYEIEKLQVINTTILEEWNLVKIWKEALEKSQVVLGHYENAIRIDRERSTEIERFFGKLRPSAGIHNYVGQFKKKTARCLQGHFSITIALDSDEREVEDLALFLSTYFELPMVEEC